VGTQPSWGTVKPPCPNLQTRPMSLASPLNHIYLLWEIRIIQCGLQDTSWEH
jgi:hypothetical protein